MHTGEKIRSIRVLKGLSQENMAEMLDMTVLSYGNIERGKTNVSEDRLKQIADIFKVSEDFILEFGERIQYFFDQCTTAVGVIHGGQTNNYDARELQHENEKLQLQIDKLKLEVEKLFLEKEKAELELKLHREKIVSSN